MNVQTHPKDITIDRAAEMMTIEWGDGAVATYPLRWLRANCPCANCRELRRQATEVVDMLQLNTSSSLDPSTEIAKAELVGNYALRLEWTDGHGSGIFGFGALREAMDLEKLGPNGSPHFNFHS